MPSQSENVGPASISASRATGSDRRDTADWAEYTKKGLGRCVGWGSSPALLVIDMSNGFNDPAFALGADQGAVVAHISQLIAACRAAGAPVIYSTTAYEDGEQHMLLCKIPSLRDFRARTTAVEIVSSLAPREDELVMTKKFPSSFIGTELLATLAAAQIDTLIVTGCSTSGCVRAASVDGISYGFRVIVPEEAVFDRSERAHRASLFDIDAKFGDVLTVAQVLERLPRTATSTEGPTGVATL